MLQFVILASDGTDAAALERRMSARPDHLTGAKFLKDNGHYVIGGATLDAEGRMNGSIMIVQFETADELKQWLAKEPYLKNNVWQQMEIKPFKVADV